jgi:hypothetical protein
LVQVRKDRVLINQALLGFPLITAISFFTLVFQINNRFSADMNRGLGIAALQDDARAQPRLRLRLGNAGFVALIGCGVNLGDVVCVNKRLEVFSPQPRLIVQE